VGLPKNDPDDNYHPQTFVINKFIRLL